MSARRLLNAVEERAVAVHGRDAVEEMLDPPTRAEFTQAQMIAARTLGAEVEVW